MTEPKCGFERLPDGRFEVIADNVVVGYADDQMQAAELMERVLGKKRKREEGTG